MQTYRKTQGKCFLFIDFKSAYNTVDRDILQEIMSAKNILTANELQFLRYLHDKIYFVGNGERHYFKNGVGQGLTTLPGLFDIYMEEIMKQVKKECNFDLWYLLYADDLVFVASYHQTEIILHAKKII